MRQRHKSISAGLYSVTRGCMGVLKFSKFQNIKLQSNLRNLSFRTRPFKVSLLVFYFCGRFNSKNKPSKMHSMPAAVIVTLHAGKTLRQ